MSRVKRTGRRWLIAIVLALCIFGFLGWMLFSPHTFQAGPVPLATAQSRCPFAFPNTARNIYIATHRHWMQTAVYIRFEAPPEDCQGCARRLMPSAGGIELDTTSAAALQPPLNPSGAFGDLSWLDFGKITRGKQFGKRGPGESVIYVDSERGIFYYLMTD